MAILNSFVNDIFERIATEASSASLFLTVLLTTRLLTAQPLRTCVVLEKVDYLITRNSDGCSSHPSR